MKDLTNKVIVVVEGGHGIGLIISKALINRGAQVHILCKDLPEAEKAVQEELFIEADGKKTYRATASQCNTGSISVVILMTNCTKASHGRVDYVINPMDMSND